MDYSELADELTEAEGELWQRGEQAQLNDAPSKADTLFTLSAVCNSLARVLRRVDTLDEDEGEAPEDTLRTTTKGLEAVSGS